MPLLQPGDDMESMHHVFFFVLLFKFLLKDFETSYCVLLYGVTL